MNINTACRVFDLFCRVATFSSYGFSTANHLALTRHLTALTEVSVVCDPKPINYKTVLVFSKKKKKTCFFPTYGLDNLACGLCVPQNTKQTNKYY